MPMSAVERRERCWTELQRTTEALPLECLADFYFKMTNALLQDDRVSLESALDAMGLAAESIRKPVRRRA